MKLKIIGASLRNNLGVSWTSGATPFKQCPWIYSLPDPQRLAVSALHFFFFLNLRCPAKESCRVGHASSNSPEMEPKVQKNSTPNQKGQIVAPRSSH